MKIFDGRTIYGFDIAGSTTSVLRSEVETVAYRHGGASVKGGGHKIWVPLSLLDTDEAHLTSIKDLLNEAAG